MRKVLGSNYFLAIIYLFFAFLAFGNLPNTFFQQDEWVILGNYIYWQEAHLNWLQRLFTYGQYTHLIPLSNIYSFVQFQLFQMQFYQYAISSIVFHFANSLLVFYFSNLLLKKKIPAFLAGYFFLINSISHQATTWIATASGTQGAVFFLLLCLIFFTKYLVDNSGRRKHLYISLLFLVASLSHYINLLVLNISIYKLIYKAFVLEKLKKLA